MSVRSDLKLGELTWIPDLARKHGKAKVHAELLKLEREGMVELRPGDLSQAAMGADWDLSMDGPMGSRLTSVRLKKAIPVRNALVKTGDRSMATRKKTTKKAAKKPSKLRKAPKRLAVKSKSAPPSPNVAIAQAVKQTADHAAVEMKKMKDRYEAELAKTRKAAKTAAKKARACAAAQSTASVKKAAKKATKKATKKAAPKRTTKKAVRKAAPKKAAPKRTTKKAVRKAAPKRVSESMARRVSDAEIGLGRPGGNVAGKGRRAKAKKVLKTWVCAGPNYTGCGTGVKGGHVIGVPTDLRAIGPSVTGLTPKSNYYTKKRRR